MSWLEILGLILVAWLLLVGFCVALSSSRRGERENGWDHLANFLMLMWLWDAMDDWGGDGLD
jgi:Ca2+/H+ antiporter